MQLRILSPLQQELMSWHHCIYHLPLPILLCLAPMSLLSKWLLEWRNNPPLCVPCQFGVAHRHPWRTKGKKSGLINRPEQTIPRDGVLVYQIVSDQSSVISQMSGFLTSQIFLGCINLVDHVSDYVYVHLMIDLSISETLLDKEALE